MRTILAAALVLSASLTVGTANAQQAHIEYPWCAVYGGDMGGASNCGFTTWEQCMATVSGIGGSCEPNQFYTPRAQAAPKRKRRAH